jgi:hypothetical protein
VFVGLALQAIGLAWLAAIVHPGTSFGDLVPAFVISGVGMAMFFAPTANLILSTVRRDEEGIASGAANALREIGGVFGVAILASVFSGYGGYASPHTFAAGLQPAVDVGAVAVGLAALILLAVPRRRAESAVAPSQVGGTRSVDLVTTGG